MTIPQITKQVLEQTRETELQNRGHEAEGRAAVIPEPHPFVPDEGAPEPVPDNTSNAHNPQVYDPAQHGLRPV
jgi:hypothetical protein